MPGGGCRSPQASGGRRRSGRRLRASRPGPHVATSDRRRCGRPLPPRVQGSAARRVHSTSRPRPRISMLSYPPLPPHPPGRAFEPSPAKSNPFSMLCDLKSASSYLASARCKRERKECPGRRAGSSSPAPGRPWGDCCQHEDRTVADPARVPPAACPAGWRFGSCQLLWGGAGKLLWEDKVQLRIRRARLSLYVK